MSDDDQYSLDPSVYDTLANDYGVRNMHSPGDFYGYVSPDDDGRKSSSSYSGYTYGSSYANGTNGSAYGGWLASNPLSGNNAFSGNQGSTGRGPNADYDPRLGMKDGGSHNAGRGGGGPESLGWNLGSVGVDSGGGSDSDTGRSAGTTPTTGFNYTVPNNMPPFMQPQQQSSQPMNPHGTNVGTGVTEYKWSQPGQSYPALRQFIGEQGREHGVDDMTRGVDDRTGNKQGWRSQWDMNDEGYKPTTGNMVPQLDMRNGGAGSPPPFLAGGTDADRTTGRWDTRDNFIQGTGRDASELNQMYPHGLFPDAIDKGSGLANDYSDPKYGRNYMPQGRSFADKFGDADAQQVARNHAQQKAGNYPPGFLRDDEPGASGPRAMSPQKEAFINAPKSQRDAYWQADPSQRPALQQQMMDGGSRTADKLPEFMQPFDAPGLLGGSAVGRQTQLNRGDNLYSGTTVKRMFPQGNQSLAPGDNGAGHQSQVSSSAGFHNGYTPDQWRQVARQHLRDFDRSSDFELPWVGGATRQILQPQYAPEYHYPPGQHYPDPIQSGQIEALLEQLTSKRQQQYPPFYYSSSQDNIFE